MNGKLDSILRTASSFWSNSRGNVAFFVAVTAIPGLIGIGAAIDYARLARFSAQLKAASDAAALAGAAETVDPTIPLTATLSAQRRTIAINAFHANMGAQPELTGITVTVTDIPNGIRVNASANAPNVFGQILGNEFTRLGALSEAGLATISNYEVAFVLDNTGSMGASGKLTTLKSAMNKFLGKLQAASTSANNVRVSIVPFSNMVKLNPTFAAGKPWVAQASSDLTAWGGCVGDRALPYDANGAAADISTPATLYQAIDANYQVFPLPPLTSFFYPFTQPNPGAPCNNAPIMPLTTDFGAMYNSVASMVATGTTNLTVGLAWGLNVLTPGEPFGTANNFGGSHNKILVLLTDGLNTQSRWTSDTATMNASTRAMCDTIKSKGITIYTIGVMNEDAALLTYCASTPAKHFFAPSPDRVPDLFNLLASDLTTVRLTK